VGHILFLDEAGHPDQPGFVLGGIAVEMARWQAVSRAWARRYRPVERPSSEVKWNTTRSLNGKAGRLARVLQDADATAFAVVIDTAASRTQAPKLFGTDAKQYATALMFVVERFQRLLERVDSHGMVVIDQRETVLDERLREFFARVSLRGTAYRTLDRVLTPILLTPSHHALGVQAADLVVGSLHALTRPDGHVHVTPERRAVAAELHAELLGCFDRHPDTGELEGVGIKRFPTPAPRPTGKLFDPA
jgi:hypothetical protein